MQNRLTSRFNESRGSRVSMIMARAILSNFELTRNAIGFREISRLYNGEELRTAACFVSDELRQL